MGFLMYFYLFAIPVAILSLPFPFINRSKYGLTFNAEGEMQFVTARGYTCSEFACHKFPPSSLQV